MIKLNFGCDFGSMGDFYAAMGAFAVMIIWLAGFLYGVSRSNNERNFWNGRPPGSRDD
jgi:hypothetical protein